MNNAQTAAATDRIVTDESLDSIFARSEGATVTPFNRDRNVMQPHAYADLRRRRDPVETSAMGQSITDQDARSIMAVLEHLAHSQGLKLKVLQALVEAEFSVENLRHIPHYQFHNVMEFLIDLRMEGVRSRR